MADKVMAKKGQPKKRRHRFSLFSVNHGKIDYVFLILVLVILTIGMIALFSASFANAFELYQNSFYFISKQVIYGIGGVVMMLFISTINPEIYNRLVWPIYGVTIFLLMIVFAFRELNNANRWIIIGSMTFQPSEIAKFTVAVVLAHMINLNYNRMNTFRYGILPPLVAVVPIIILVLIEPHLSGAILITGIAAVMMFVGGVQFRWFAALGGVGALGLYGIYKTEAIHYVSDRIEVWRNPYSDYLGTGYQTIQSLIAIGSGGLMGQGIGGSTQKYRYLPELQNDYIFAIVCEELGFVGASIIIILFALLVWRGFLIATRCDNRFGSLLAIGLTAQVGIQVIFNIMVITNTVPPTGISLPFFSSGGTSLIMLLCQMGVVLSISRQSKADEFVEVDIKR